MYFLGLVIIRRCPARGQKFAFAHPVIGKIHCRLGPGQGRKQAGTPILIEPGQRALILTQGLAELGGGFRIGQVGDGLGTGKVETAIFDGPAAEFSRLGGAKAQSSHRRKQSVPYRPAAMNMEFGDIFTGETVRPRKPEQKRFIQHGFVPE